MEKISLPIDAELSRIIKAFNEFPNLILTASPGSGKTTRVPPALLQLSELKNKKIIVLVPKRIAALSAASRVADETETTIGEAVGYQVRFDNRSQAQTRLIYMTEGVFIKKINDSSFWQSIGVIVFDEFHERSSNMDLALGISLEKQILGEDLKLIVMSATLNAEKLLNFLPDSKWIDVENKPFPLTIVNSKKSQRLACDQAFADNLIETLQTALTKTERDILIFLPGLSEMRFIERQLLPKFSKFEINILHGSTKLEEQRRILTPQSHRRIILATNIAESSVTLPSVDLVIDSGLEKKSVTETKIGFKRLELGRISMFSAQQRAGRAARVKEGYCFRLWHSMDELSMPAQIEPEILTSDLFNETLTLLSSGITDPKNFSWLDRPSKSFEDVLAQLNKWQLIDDQRHITAYGRSVQNCPLDLERSVLFVALAQAGFQKEAARLLSFIETAAFDKLTEAVDLRLLPLNEMARKIEQQLLQIRIATVKESSTLNFKTQIIKTFFEKFPNKIAKKKEKNLAVSSLGRGLELAPYLVNNTDQYYLLIDGREISSALTRAEFAIGFTQAEFEQLSAEHIQVVTETH
ncbi:MAG: helicase-related protein, partial [Pseudobdellovibrio sp.]